MITQIAKVTTILVKNSTAQTLHRHPQKSLTQGFTTQATDPNPGVNPQAKSHSIHWDLLEKKDVLINPPVPLDRIKIVFLQDSLR
jgi:hypothetical protein